MVWHLKDEALLEPHGCPRWEEYEEVASSDQCGLEGTRLCENEEFMTPPTAPRAAIFPGCGEELSCSGRPLPHPVWRGCGLELPSQAVSAWYPAHTMLVSSFLPYDSGEEGKKFTLSPRTWEIHVFS